MHHQPDALHPRGAGRSAQGHHPAHRNTGKPRDIAVFLPICPVLCVGDYWQMQEHRQRCEELGGAGFLRLARLIRARSSAARLVDCAELPEVAYPLVNKLTSAKLVPPARLPADVVTIGSQLSYRDELTGRTQQVTLAWPEDADISRGIVSIRTPVGVALLGLSAGDRFRWTTRAGEERAMTVLEVVTERAIAAGA